MRYTLYFLRRCATQYVRCGIEPVGKKAYSSVAFKDLKKFYKNAHITQVAGRPGYYEVNLDQRKLKTPLGNTFQVPGQELALATATEWNSQKDCIKRHTMHITSLCNTAIDNPTQKTRSQIVRKICHYLGSDTLCFRMDEPEKLVKFQQENWDTILNWFRERYDIELKPTVGIVCPQVPEETYARLEKQLMSYTDWSLVGLEHIVDCLKSLSLTLALIECEIDVPRAVYLSRLEQVFQTAQWGNVEWYHDIDIMETQARYKEEKDGRLKCVAESDSLQSEELTVAAQQLQKLVKQKIFTDLVPDLFGVGFPDLVSECEDDTQVAESSNVSFRLSNQLADKLLYESSKIPDGLTPSSDVIQQLFNRKLATNLLTDLHEASKTHQGCCEIIVEQLLPRGFKEITIELTKSPPLSPLVETAPSLKSTAESLTTTEFSAHTAIKCTNTTTPESMTFHYTRHPSHVEKAAGCRQQHPISKYQKFRAWTKDHFKLPSFARHTKKPVKPQLKEHYV